MYWLDEYETHELFKTLWTCQRIGLISDFDGTLSPIVDDPNAAAIAPSKKALLRQLAERLALVALVSGRDAQNLYGRVEMPELVYVGNHGFEQWQAGEVVYHPEAEQYRGAIRALSASLALDDGMELEDKGLTLALHYRQVAKPKRTAEIYRPILQNLTDKLGLNVSQGRMIFEVKPPIDVNKGTALRQLRQQHQLDALVFLGDDTTDADAMQAAHELRQAQTCHAVTLGVKSAEMPQVVRDHSDFLVDDPDDVERFLERFLASVSA